jgi:fructokinase
MHVRYGIDLGGTKIEIVALDADNAVLHRHRAPTPGGDYAGTIDAISALVAEADTQLSEFVAGTPASVGVGIPGTISPASGLVKNANSTCLIGKPFQADLESALGRPVRLANDANCFALSEASDGSGKGFKSVFGVILGTGVGGGLVIGGACVTGANAIGGEWGHNPLPWPDPDLKETPGPPCYCGLHGCIETFLSGPGFARDAALGTDAWEVVRRAYAGDAAATSALERYCVRLARSLATVINIADPDVIVLGGGLSNISALYDVVPRLWSAYVFSDTVETKLLPPTHGDSSGVRGAAWLWPLDQA